MSPDDSQNCGESKAPTCELRREKGIKDFGHGFFVHPTARVLNLQANVRPGLRVSPVNHCSCCPFLHVSLSRADYHGAWTVAARLRCIDDQIHCELLDLSGINFDSGKAVPSEDRRRPSSRWWPSNGVWSPGCVLREISGGSQSWLCRRNASICRVSSAARSEQLMTR
jgi:hypothetical protein